MTNEEAQIIIGNIPIKPEVLDDCYDITEYQEAKTMAIQALAQTRWIPVSERLPEKLNDVLITFYDCPNEYDVAYLRTTFNESYKKSGAKNEWVSSMGETTYADYEVDAWMPIHPYKAEGSDTE